MDLGQEHNIFASNYKAGVTLYSPFKVGSYLQAMDISHGSEQASSVGNAVGFRLQVSGSYKQHPEVLFYVLGNKKHKAGRCIYVSG